MIEPHLQRERGYLLARFSGEASLADCFRMIQTIRFATIEFQDSHLLLDLRQVRDALTPADEAAITLQAVQAFAHLRKVASIVRSRRHTGRSEKLAAGFPLRLFVSETEAVAWLRAPS